MSIVFTMPGKLGDSLLQWPVAHQFWKQTGQLFELWIDETTCKPLEPLFRAQPCVSSVRLISGVENWNCGGQPFHMNLPTSAFEGNTIYHLGFRAFPVRQITLQTANDVKLPVEIDLQALSSEPSLVIPEAGEKHNRLIVHGQGVCAHTRNTPMMWRFLSRVWREVSDLFDEIVFVGNDRDLEVGTRAYPEAKGFADGGDFLKLARYMSESRAAITTGSCVAALADCLKLPCIRVHDPIAENAPKVIWSNLDPRSINDTELELRDSWPKWRDATLLNAPVGTP